MTPASRAFAPPAGDRRPLGGPQGQPVGQGWLASLPHGLAPHPARRTITERDAGDASEDHEALDEAGFLAALEAAPLPSPGRRMACTMACAGSNWSLWCKAGGW